MLAIDVEAASLDVGNMTVTLSDPTPVIPYYFKVVACNVLGEGIYSDVSGETVIGILC